MNEKGRRLRCLKLLRLKTDEIDRQKAKLQTSAVRKAFGILREKNGVLLADEVGMGKTFEALALIFLECYYRMKYGGSQKIPTVLVIVPSAALRTKWEKDIHKFLEKCVNKRERLSNLIRDGLSDVRVIYGKTDLSKLAHRRRLVITSISSLFSNPLYKQWDIVVIDEAHKFKNRRSVRYALFDNSSRKDVEPILYRRFKKLILMTATPFQLEPSEMANLLRLILSANPEDDVTREEVDSRLGELERQLVDYQRRIDSFEASWKQIPHSEQDAVTRFGSSNEHLIADVKNGIEDASLNGATRRALSRFREVLEVKKSLQSLLKLFIVRNSKTKEHRRDQSGSLVPGATSTVQLKGDEELFYLLVNRFLYEVGKKEKTFAVQVLQETTSSYSTLDKYSISSRKKVRSVADSDRTIRWYLNLLSTSIGILRQKGEGQHPKIRELKVNLQLRGNDQELKELPREKTLIFCRFIETADVIRRQINDDCTEVIGKKISPRIRDAFRKRYLQKIRVNQGGKRTTGVWRFSERFENLLKRGNSRVFTLLDSLFENNPHMKAKLQEQAEFRFYTREGRLERYNKVMQRELEDVLRRKLKEPGLLFLIMQVFQEKLRDTKFNSRLATQMMRESIENVFEDRLFTYVKRESEGIERSFSELPEEDCTLKITRLIDGLRRQDFAEVLSGNTKPIFQDRVIEAFNTEFNPKILIVTQVGQEGLDLQKECSRVIHYDLWWNPATMEQRVGRVDRIGSKISREREVYERNGKTSSNGGPKLEIYTPYIRDTVDETIYRIVKEREKWFQLIVGNKQTKEERLFGHQAEMEADIVLLPYPMLEALRINLEP